MKVREVMTSRVESCPPDADLGTAALVMWRNDCGIVPIVEPKTRGLLGVITDRDICMALATTGKRPDERTVAEVTSGETWSVAPDADVKEALDLMRRKQVHRLPVTAANGALEGIVSLNDLILRADGARGTAENRVPLPELLQTLKGVSAHRTSTVAPAIRGEVGVGIG